jgi:hypothetical protein
VSGSSNITLRGNSRLSLLPECHFSGASRVNSSGNLFPAPKILLLRVEQIPCYNKKLSEPIYDNMIEEKVKRAASRLNECRGNPQTRTRRRDSMILGILTSLDGLLGAIQPHTTTKQNDMGIFVSVDRL